MWAEGEERIGRKKGDVKVVKEGSGCGGVGGK